MSLKQSVVDKIPIFHGYLIIAGLLLLGVSSCNPTKYVPEGQTLLGDNNISVVPPVIKESELSPYIRQKPNKKIFGTRFHLGLYNLSNIEKSGWPHSWLRNIGEEPVVFDKYSMDKSREQIMDFISSKGYFDSRVNDTVTTVKRKSEVSYKVSLRSPYTIRNVFYEFADTTLQNLFFFDSVNCLIERGKPYDVDVLQSELKRFERFIRDRGFYGFSGDHIFFRIDSTIGNRQVNVYYGVRNALVPDQYNRVSYVPHSVYRIKDVYIFPDFVPKEMLEGGEAYLQSLDTVNIDGYYFVSPKGRPELKPEMILQSLYIRPGSLYNVTNTERSQTHLLSLKAHRLINIYFKDSETEPLSGNSEKMLDCNIQLTLLSPQSFRVELEGTNSAGNLGGALNLVYQHKNLFHGAEQFNMKLKGAYEALSQKDVKLKSTQEYGIETSLRLPQFLVPFLKKEGFIKNYNPATNLLAAYNYQNMPFYKRSMANATFGYTWNGNNYTTHIVNPVQLNVVTIDTIDPVFWERIRTSSYLASAYTDVTILGGNYSLIFNNQKIQKSRDYWFVRLNAEATGNMLGLVGKLANLKKSSEGAYKILGQPFAQYVRIDIDGRYNVILNDVSSIVYRGFVGVGIPYGNSRAIPFEKQYFGGGANGIRAWQVRSLGPGSYKPADLTFLNQTADIKIEANAEYRFKLFWILEGALFLDAGNIWAFNEDPSMPGSKFDFTNFYKDIAVGTGAGFRFDFKFVIGRVDLGMKLRDPVIADGSKWIIMNRHYNFKDDFTVVLAIGYPF